MKAIHVVRNPFDQISTCALYKDYNHLVDYTEMALQENAPETTKHLKKPNIVSNYKAAMTALQVKGDNKHLQQLNTMVKKDWSTVFTC